MLQRSIRSLVMLAAVLLAPLPALAAAEDYTHGLLWKVEKPGVAPSYVFGTFHSADPKIMALPKPVLERLHAADSVSIELEFTSDILAQLQHAGQAKGGLTLDRLIAPDLLEAVVKKAGEYGLKREEVVAMKPWAVAELLFSTPPSEQKWKKDKDCRCSPFLDLWLLLEAMRTGKAHSGLESAEEQIAVFDAMPRSVQIGLLKSSLDTTAEDKEFARMRKQYLARDIGGLMEGWRDWLAQLDPKDAAVLNARMLDERNRRMVRRMGVRLDQGNAFISMGALHLPGEAGILNLLQARGYQVTEIY